MKIKNKDKTITVVISLCLVFMVFGVGYIGIQSITKIDISGQPASNLTMLPGGGNVMDNILLPLMIIGAIALISSTLFFAVSSTSRFARLGKIAKFLASSGIYFGYGMVFVVILAIPSYLIYLLYNFAVVEGNVVATYETLKWIGIMTGAFFGIAGLGYVFKKYFVDRLNLRLKEKKMIIKR